MIALARTMFRSRELLWQLAWRDIRSRHKQSVIGVAWIVLQPLLLAAIFTVVFTKIVPIETDIPYPYPLFCFAGLVPWTFFATAVTFSTNSVVTSANLVRKVAFPRETLVVSSVLSSLVNLAMTLAVALIMMLVYRFILGDVRVRFHWSILWIVPLFAVSIVLALAVGFLLSAINVFFRDVAAAVPLLLRVWFFATPIVYSLSQVQENLSGKWLVLYRANPMVAVVSSFRSALLGGAAPEWKLIGTAALVSAVLLVPAYYFFKWGQQYFADVI